jgi:GcrA cell cycle regulator
MSRFNVGNAGWSGAALAWLKENWPLFQKKQLAEVLGCSPNAVVGKAHRMDLPKKPSPIKRAVPDTGPRIHRPHRATGAKPMRKLKGPKPPKQRRAPTPYRGRPYDGDGCAWPFGDPGTAAFRLCCGDPVNGSPYCEDHYKRAYVPRPARMIAAECLT